MRFFLRNRREAIVALDLFTVPTATFRVLYCLFVIEHGRRRILHFNFTRHPSADWVVQQWRESFPAADPYRDAILDAIRFSMPTSLLLEDLKGGPSEKAITHCCQNGH